MRYLSPVCGALAAILLAAPAQLGASDTSFGVQFSTAFTGSDLEGLSAAHHGLSGGINGTIDFGEGHAMRPRIDFSRYQGHRVIPTDDLFAANVGLHSNAKVDQFALGADYLYYFRKNVDQGPYVLAGIGAVSTSWSSDLTLDTSPQVKTQASFRRTSTYAQIGLGWQFTRAFGLEVRQQLTYLDTDVAARLRAPGYQNPVEVPLATGRQDLGVTYLTATVRF